MKKELKLPNLGENITSAEVIKVLVAVGDKIELEQAVAEISSDKATLEIPSDVSGVIKEINIKEGDSITEGQTVLTVETENGTGAAPAQAEDNSRQEVSNAENASPLEKVKPQTVETEIAGAASGSDTVDESPAAAPPQETAKSTGGGSSSFLLPNLGENIASAEILKVLVKVGDKLEKEQAVIEISSDKATLEVPSDVSGIIKEIKVKEGDSVAEGQEILTVESDGGQAPAAKQQSAAARPATTPISAESAPNTEKPPAADKATGPVDQTAAKETIQQAASPKKPKEIAPAAPSVRRFAREIGIDINLVNGSGPGGRISIEDVKTYSRGLNKGGTATSRAAASSTGGYTETLPDFAKWGEISREPMNNVRFKTAQHLGYAWATIPHVTHFEKADITELEKLRKNYGKKVELAGGKLTMTSILLKIIASALKAFPKFNASIDLEKKEIILKKYIHLGLAVDTDRGLLVPVIRNVDQKNITEISVEVGQVAEKARSKKITLEEMQGATFTISNLGGIGGVGFTPVVNSPEVAILGVSQSSYEPVYKEGQFEPRLIMPISLSYDHRLIDGADAARFMRWVKEAIENPFLLVLEG